MRYNNITVDFIVPTPWRDTKGEVECINGLSSIAQKLGLDYKIYFVCNEWNLKPEFQTLKFNDPNVIIMGHNYNYSISVSLNTVLKTIRTSSNSEYVCFVQSDVHFKNENWLKRCIDVYDMYEDIGVIGFQKHSTRHTYPEIPFTTIGEHEFLKTLFADGFMFFDSKFINEVGLFDEQFYGDRESEDFCYRVNNLGYHNLRLLDSKNEINHYQIPFHKKTNSNPEEYMKSVDKTQILFKEKWKDLKINW